MPSQMNFVSFYHETTALSSIFISVDEVNCISADEVNEMSVGINLFSLVSPVDLFNYSACASLLISKKRKRDKKR